MAERRRIVVSGCSGGGKTTLLNAMADQGYAVRAEPGRRVVQAGVSYVDAPEAFLQECATLAVQDHAAAGPGITLYDRSFLEVLVWYARHGHDVPSEIAGLIGTRGYDPVVYLTPPWREIYVTDAERQHGFDQACAEYDALCEHLPNLGYDIRVIPKLPVADRVAWLTQTLQL